MSSKKLQSFASGLFIATAALGGMYYFVDRPAEIHIEDEHTDTPTVQEMKVHLEQEGYVVLPKEEVDMNKEDEKNEIEEDEQATETQPVYMMVLQITKGMTSSEIAEQLIAGRIISDQKAFLDLVSKKDAAQSFQIGEYELSSDQSIEEILATLTKSP